jgi:putative addiction module killer protein
MNINEIELLTYQTANGKMPFSDWLKDLKDIRTKSIIRSRLARIRNGNIGDLKLFGKDLGEIRIHFGPGYRIYFGQLGKIIVILLCAGDKASQKRDILKAFEYWADYKRRLNETI